MYRSASDSIEIRDAVGGDIPQLHTLIGALATHHDDVANVTLAQLKSDIFGKPPWIYTIVAEQNGQLVGYSILCPLVQIQFGARGMDIHHLYVDRGMRGIGLGRDLITASKEKSRSLGCSFLMVGTHPDNLPAQKVYKSYGFQERATEGPRFKLAIV